MLIEPQPSHNADLHVHGTIKAHSWCDSLTSQWTSSYKISASDTSHSVDSIQVTDLGWGRAVHQIFTADVGLGSDGSTSQAVQAGHT